MDAIHQELDERGELVGTAGLAGPDAAKIVTTTGSGRQSSPTALPGGRGVPGYWLVDVESEALAVEIAARTSAAPGPGGKAGAKEIQVRPLMHAPPDPERMTAISVEDLLREVGATGPRHRRPAIRQLRGGRGRGAGGAACRCAAVAGGRPTRQPPRVARDRVRTANDRSAARRARPPGVGRISRLSTFRQRCRITTTRACSCSCAVTRR